MAKSRVRFLVTAGVLLSAAGVAASMMPAATAATTKTWHIVGADVVE